LLKARDCGNFLVVGLNTDESVKIQNKAPNRPINNELSRAKVLAAIGAVDLVILFGEETPLELITLLKPDVLVKGGDYKENEIVGYKETIAIGGKVVIIPLVEGFSTSNLISKIK
jgi:D-beta-D-heptose 7-phosphate kinase/D-beta-D-heptose 1-phosphate adenosyltransferase